MAILGSILGIAGGAAAATTAGGAGTSALMSALTAATATGATGAASAGAGSALTGALTAATSGAAGAGAGTAAGSSSALMGALTAATAPGATAATTTGGLTAAGLGKAAAIGAVTGGATNAGTAAIQGGSAADITKAGIKGAITGAASGLLTGGASAIKGAAEAAKAAPAGTTSTASGVEGSLPDVGKAATNLKPTGSLSSNAPQLRPKADIMAPVEMKATTGQKVIAVAKNTANSKPGQAVGKIASQYGVQGVLSVASGIQASKQASAANAISQQGLLFQQQSYNEQKAEQEKYKAGMKQTALTAYESTNLFGSNLKESSPSSTLLTSNAANGNTGDFSLLTTGVTTSRKSDLT